jgi:hypothetical protein
MFTPDGTPTRSRPAKVYVMKSSKLMAETRKRNER